MGTSRQQKATLHDVAARVGVSPRTVSRVVNEEGGFSAATRQRVLEAIAELGYRPNLVARSLITKRSDIVALIVPVIDDPFFPELAQGVQAAAREQNLTMFLAVTDDKADLELQLLERLSSHAVDGAILFPTTGSVDGLRAIADQGLAVVVVDDDIEHPNICSVRSDLEHGVTLAVDHLRQRGCRRLAMLANGSSPPRKRRRERAFRTIEGERAVVARSEANYDGGYRAMSEVLTDHPDVDGVFAYNDVMAIGAITAVHEAGRTVPGDMAVVGCDDIEMSARVSPSLTTIRLDRERLGVEAVARLLELRNSGQRSAPVTIPVSLVVRQST